MTVEQLAAYELIEKQQIPEMNSVKRQVRGWHFYLMMMKTKYLI